MKRTIFVSSTITLKFHLDNLLLVALAEDLALPSLARLETFILSFSHTDGDVNDAIRFSQVAIPLVTLFSLTTLSIRIPNLKRGAFDSPTWVELGTMLSGSEFDGVKNIEILFNTGLRRAYYVTDRNDRATRKWIGTRIGSRWEQGVVSFGWA